MLRGLRQACTLIIAKFQIQYNSCSCQCCCSSSLSLMSIYHVNRTKRANHLYINRLKLWKQVCNSCLVRYPAPLELAKNSLVLYHTHLLFHTHQHVPDAKANSKMLCSENTHTHTIRHRSNLFSRSQVSAWIEFTSARTFYPTTSSKIRKEDWMPKLTTSW